MNNSAYFLVLEEEESPAWKVIMNLDKLDEPVVGLAVQRMKDGFDRREIRKPGEMLHVFALMMMLSEKKVIAEKIEELGLSCRKYIDDLLTDDELEPLELKSEEAQRLEDNYDGFSYWVLNTYKDEFDKLKNYLEEARGTARDRELAIVATDLLKILRKNSQEFAKEISYVGGIAGRFAADALLHNIPPDEFVDAWLENSPSNWSVVRNALENRYVPGSRLEKEIPWMQDVLEVLKDRVENAQDIRSLQISRVVPNVQIVASESEEGGP